jgi:bifunctional non-homologous end joining protein LigD
MESNGIGAFETAKRRGYEGIVAKDPDAPYRGGSSPLWQKVKLREADFVIGGYRGPGDYVGSLLLSAYRDGALYYMGEVEFGLAGSVREVLWGACQPLVVSVSPLRDLTRKRNATWLTPQLVAEVSYQERLGGELHHPAFRGISREKGAEECRVAEAG